MNFTELVENIRRKKTALCIGLDSDIEKIPSCVKNKEYPLFEFNKQIIDKAHEFCVAVKPNIAFYESLGTEGWKNLELSVKYIRKKYPDLFLIADAKRGDIGNTSNLYAKAFFENMDFHAVTVAPYMGEDSIKPFYNYPGKWVVILALTSNKGAFDFQLTIDAESRKPLYRKVIEKSNQWGTPENTMFVVGATKAESFESIRDFAPDSFLLVPGVGVQGGDLETVMKYGMSNDIGLLINASRSIIYASNEDDFAEKAAEEAKIMSGKMAKFIN